MRIGFIGLGNMGAPMASNLAKAGHEVVGFDIAGISIDGIESVTSVESAVVGMNAVITMLPNGEILQNVYTDIVTAGDAGAVFIDCSTVDVDSALKAHDLAQKHGLLSVDAPVSGGIGGASAGTLTFMAGGQLDAFEAAAPLFNIMGQKVVHCGIGGAGQAAKICNNMILGVSMLGVCEAFALGSKLNLDPAKLFDVVSTSSGSCWSVNTYCPMPGIGPVSPADNDYQPGFAAELMLKDLLLSQAAASMVDANTPIGQRATELYQSFVDQGGRGKDFSAVLSELLKHA